MTLAGSKVSTGSEAHMSNYDSASCDCVCQSVPSVKIDGAGHKLDTHTDNVQWPNW